MFISAVINFVHKSLQFLVFLLFSEFPHSIRDLHIEAEPVVCELLFTSAIQYFQACHTCLDFSITRLWNPFIYLCFRIYSKYCLRRLNHCRLNYTFSIQCYLSDTQPVCAGSNMVNVLPCPELVSTFTSPSCTLTICLTIARPRPVPPILRLRALSTR